MEINVDLTDYCVHLNDMDYDTMINLLGERPEDFMETASDLIVEILEDDFDEYFPYVEKLYNKIKELKEKNNG